MMQFYMQCLEKGYVDMNDDTQSLKAKVIATDLGLKYGDIVKFFEKAKQVYDEEKAESERKAVDGENLFSVILVGGTKLHVFLRPDKSVYYTEEGSAKKYEGIDFSVNAGGVVNYSYNPSKIIYTGASSGGIHMGGLHQTEASYTVKTNKTGRGDVIAILERGENKIVEKVEIASPYVEIFKRHKWVKGSGGVVSCNTGSLADSIMAKTAITSNAGYGDKMTMLSQAVDNLRLPVDDCKEIADLLNSIIKQDFPPKDDEVYEEADRLSKHKDSYSLKIAADIFAELGNYKDSAVRAKKLQTEFEDVLQNEKEQAILQRENNDKKRRQVIKATIPVIAIFIVIGVIFAIIYTNKKKEKERYYADYLIDATYYYVITDEEKLNSHIEDGTLADYISECSVLKDHTFYFVDEKTMECKNGVMSIMNGTHKWGFSDVSDNRVVISFCGEDYIFIVDQDLRLLRRINDDISDVRVYFTDEQIANK